MPFMTAEQLAEFLHGCDQDEERDLVHVLFVETSRLRATLELCAGSVRAALEKADDAPMSADAHLQEALAVAEAEVPPERVPKLRGALATYSAGAAKLRGLLVQRDETTRLLEIERDSNKRLADTLAGCEYQRNQLLEQLRQSKEEVSKSMLEEMDRLRGEVLELRDKLKRTVTYRHVGPLVPPPYSMDDRDDD